MALSTQTAAALVAAAAPRQAPALVAVRVIRPLCVAGERIEVGETVSVTREFAGELISAGKAEAVPAAPAQPPAPPTTKAAAKAAAARPDPKE